MQPSPKSALEAGGSAAHFLGLSKQPGARSSFASTLDGLTMEETIVTPVPCHQHDSQEPVSFIYLPDEVLKTVNRSSVIGFFVLSNSFQYTITYPFKCNVSFVLCQRNKKNAD
jgi:hypothetical protein